VRLPSRHEVSPECITFHRGAQISWFWLWVFRIEVREECDIIQIPQARRIVSHHV
jgi:hypothetical protein